MHSLVCSLARICSSAVLLAFAATAPSVAHEAKAGAITIHHPWSRAVPHGAKVAAGYFTLTNAGGAPDRLLKATAEIAGRTEIHVMAVDAKGVMTMHPVAGGIEVPANGTVALEPGSYHVMFLDLAAEPQAGKPFRGTVTLEKAGTVDVEYVVEPLGGPAPAHDAGSHAGG